MEYAVSTFFENQGKDDPTKNFSWDYVLVDNDKIVNAWCMPGGKIAVYTGLLKITKNLDALSIVTPTPNHYKTAKLCIENKKHVFIEKPITVTLEEANNLLDLSKKNSTIIQVGHIERLNPALMALKPYYINPQFIEIQRLAPYTVRGTDVPVVLDKMIHDIDILLSLIKKPWQINCT